jgi:hypothetical protein
LSEIGKGEPAGWVIIFFNPFRRREFSGALYFR